MRAVTQSYMRTMMSCEEKARLRYLERMRSPTITPALPMGIAVHYGVLEAKSADDAVERFKSERAPAWLEHEADNLERDATIVRAMVEGALAVWTDWPKTTEKRFRVPFYNPDTGKPSTKHTFEGVFDGIWRPGERDNADPVLLELKTAGRLDSSYLERLDIDWQVSAYMAAASIVYSNPVRAMVYRIIRKPSIRQRKTETLSEFALRLSSDYKDRPEFYFEEVIVRRTDDQIRRWWYEAWELHERILRIENGGMTVRNSQHCLDFGRCNYFDLCRGVSGPEAFRVIDDAHPELRRRTNHEG